VDQAKDTVDVLTEEIVARVMQELPSANLTYVHAIARNSAGMHAPILQQEEALNREWLADLRQRGLGKLKQRVEDLARSERETIVSAVATTIVFGHRALQRAIGTQDSQATEEFFRAAAAEHLAHMAALRRNR
jgi:hypothetical protein